MMVVKLTTVHSQTLSLCYEYVSENEWDPLHPPSAQEE